jgi:hypothetical protein
LFSSFGSFLLFIFSNFFPVSLFIIVVSPVSGLIYLYKFGKISLVSLLIKSSFPVIGFLISIISIFFGIKLFLLIVKISFPVSLSFLILIPLISSPVSSSIILLSF